MWAAPPVSPQTSNLSFSPLHSPLPSFSPIGFLVGSGHTLASEQWHWPLPLPRKLFPKIAVSSYACYFLKESYSTLPTLFILFFFSWNLLYHIISLLFSYIRCLLPGSLHPCPTGMSAPRRQGFTSDCCTAFIWCWLMERPNVCFLKEGINKSWDLLMSCHEERMGWTVTIEMGVFLLACFHPLIRKLVYPVLILSWMPTSPLWSKRGEKQEWLHQSVTYYLGKSLSPDLIFLSANWGQWYKPPKERLNETM